MGHASRKSNHALLRFQGCIWQEMPTQESAFRIAFAWGGRLRQRSLLLNQNPYARGLDLNVVDVEIQIERLVDLDIGIARLNKLLDQKLQNRTFHGDARKLDAREENGGACVRRFDTDGNLQRTLALDQSSDQSVHRALALLNFHQID